MIIEIALGIVLAVVILRFWQSIIAFGIFAILGLAICTLGGIGMYWVATNQPLLDKVVAVVTFFSIYLIGLLIAKLIAKRTVLKVGEIGVLIVIIVFLCIATFGGIPFFTKWALEAKQPEILLFLLPIAWLWYWTWQQLAALIESRRLEISNAEAQENNQI